MRYTLLILILCLCTIAHGQKLALKKVPVLHYSSTQEQKAFEQLEPASFNTQFRLLYMGSPGANLQAQENAAQQVNSFIGQLRPRVEKAKTAQKKIKLIHKEVHATFLRKYVLANHFAEIFTKGEFNCVSGTALYALVLQELNIPFEIKETPTHVFLVAYPAAERIALESTDPLVGYLVFDTKFKAEYIGQLRKMKLISEQDYQTKGVEKLFDEMYFNNQRISLKELIALQYYNDGLYLMEEEKLEESLHQFEKGYALYPSDRGSFLIYNTLLLAKEQTTYADSAYIDYLIKIANVSGVDNQQQHLEAEFALFTQDQLSNKGQVNYYDKMYQKLAGAISDTSLANELAYIYNFERGRTALSLGQLTEALQWTESAYQLKPAATNSLGLLLTCVGQRLTTISSLDDKTSLVEGYFRRYPVLESNNVLYSQLLQLYLVRFGQAYELEQEKKGQQYRLEFEKAYLHKKGGPEAYMIDNALVGRAYSVAAVYYFKKGQTAQARKLLDKGLEIDPSNFELLQRKQLIR